MPQGPVSVPNVHVLGLVDGLCHIVFGACNGFFQGMSLRELGGDGGGKRASRAMQILALNLVSVIAETSLFGSIVKHIAHFPIFQMSAFDEYGTSVCLA